MEIDKNIKRCKNCKHCILRQCRRYPPTPLVQKTVTGIEMVVYYYPEVKDTQWCGEFKNKHFKEEK